MPRTRRAERRRNTIRKARRKQNLVKHANFLSEPFDNLHQYSKDIPATPKRYARKITRKYGHWISPRDQRRYEAMNYDDSEVEIYEGNNVEHRTVNRV